VPHIARIYDYWLGGKDNFAADREAAERAMAATPTIVPGVRANRRFLGRAVRYMAESGIRQFLDIGTGIPTANNTHEVAQAVAPDARVVYVDDDPIVLSHARALLTSTTAPTAYIDADARDTAKILAEAKVTFRTREQVSRFFSGLALADPGVVAIQDWRADSALDLNSAPTTMWGGVGRKS